MIIRSALFAAGVSVCLIAPAAGEGQVQVFGQTVPVARGTITDGQHGAASSCTVIPVTDLTPREHSDMVHLKVPGYLEAASHPQAFVYTSLHLEPGIEVTRLCARTYDTDPNHELIVTLGAFESGDGPTEPAVIPLAAMATGVKRRPAMRCSAPTSSPQCSCGPMAT
jgi:hypothetical protein